MAYPIPEPLLRAIEEIVAHTPGGIAVGAIEEALGPDVPRRTLQYHLRGLVAEGRLRRTGHRRAARYYPPEEKGETPAPIEGNAIAIPLSKTSDDILAYVSQPVAARRPAGYNREFLDGYEPNKSFYLTEDERARLHDIGRPDIEHATAGTYAKQIFNRLLIDLSWNSSRLEGNTYSLLDTKRLINFGQLAEGHEQLEAQMILNHKDAIEFLVQNAADIGFNRYTIQNLHGMLANNLLADPDAPGRIRQMVVGIDGSTFHPLEVPALIEECFDILLEKAETIEDPYEQALFAMVQLPYLQPFDDVNKRVSRLAANIPLIRANLAPLAFTDVPQNLYAKGLLGIYEMNRIDLFKDLFLWACERSAQRYAAVRQSMGEPDPFRLRYRELLRETIGEIIRAAMGRKEAARFIEEKAAKADPEDRDHFAQVAETELFGLHEGNFARYQIRPGEFANWQGAWANRT